MQKSTVTITSYFGYAVIALEWLAALTLVLLKKPDLSEPFSQYGYYADTKVLFGLFFTVASLVYYLFSKHLDRYWQHTSKTAVIAGVAFTITGWAPYTPYAQGFALDVHNLALVVSIFFFTLPMLCMGYAKKHAIVAKLSRISYIVVTAVVLATLISRSTGLAVIYLQFATIATFHIWLAIMNYFLLQHESEHDTSALI